MRLKKALISAGGIGAAAFVVLQIAPAPSAFRGVIGTNPPERFKLDATPEVEAILRKACMDCHSNETRWPWYARLAPGSWLMARDVKKGRSRMNMSEWGDSEESERALDRENAWEKIEAGEMPPWFYIPLHHDARLSGGEKALLKSWMLAKKKS